MAPDKTFLASRALHVYTPNCGLTEKSKEEATALNQQRSIRTTRDPCAMAKRTNHGTNASDAYSQGHRIRALNVYTPIRGLREKARETVEALNRVNIAKARAMPVNTTLSATRADDGQTPCLSRPIGGGIGLPRETSWVRNGHGGAALGAGRETSPPSPRPVNASRVFLGGEKQIVLETPLSGNYGTQSRTMLESQPLESDCSDFRERDYLPAQELDRQTGISNATEPVTGDFHYPEDQASPPLFLSQESRSLEDCLRRQAAGKPTSVNNRRRRSSSAVKDPEQEGQELDGHVEEENAGQEVAESEQEEPLDEIDIELIALGGDDNTILTRSPIPCPKRPRMLTTHRPGDAGVENDVDPDQKVHAKKQRTRRSIPSVEARNASIRELQGTRASNATRKDNGVPSRVAIQSEKSMERGNDKLRRLPVDELVMIDERLYDPDMEMANTPPLELSQDPISQVSEEHTDLAVDTHRQSVTLKVKLSSRRGLGIIDISKYRMPEPVPVNKQSQSRRTLFYADGFNSKEGEPIGRLMPIKQSARRTQSHLKMTIQLGELTLISEKRSDNSPEKRSRRRKRKEAVETQTAPVSIEPEDDQMLSDAREAPDQVPDAHRPKFPSKFATNLQTLVIDRSLLSTSTPAGHTSPLKYKLQHNRPTSTGASILQIRPKAASQEPAIEHRQASKVPEPLISTPAPSSSRSSIQIREDLITSQEIGLVTMKRSAHSDSGEVQGHEISTNLILAANAGEPEDEGGDSSGEEACLLFSVDESEQVDADNRFDMISSDPAPSQNYEKTLADDNEYEDFATDEQDYEPKEDSTRESTGSQLPVGTLCPSRASKDVQNNTKTMLLELYQVIESVKSKKRRDLKGSRSTDSTATPRYTSRVVRRCQASQGSLGATSSIARRVPEVRDDQRADQSQQKPLYSNYTDSSWRPTIPDTSGLNVQVDEEIIDIPTPPLLRRKAALERRQSLRARSMNTCKPLNTSKKSPGIQTQEVLPVEAHDTQDGSTEPGGSQNIDSQSFSQRSKNSVEEVLPSVTLDSQGGSIELGDSQKFSVRSFASTIPETQLLEIPEEHHTQVMVQDTTYFSQASQQLDLPSRHSITSRLSPTPARVHFAQHEESHGDGMMAGEISISAAFQHTISSQVKTPSSQRLGSSQQTPSRGRSLKELTRQASLGMGTVLLGNSARKGSRKVCITSLHQQFNLRS